ncbi:MAG: hypothetical protein A4E53_02973 [Pelotomaculum sp. PtaB.Bin104]|nr:MAG: hypothetical protein A4E53_02973 [Pelotomaculum sp. PtaB.Bin104]
MLLVPAELIQAIGLAHEAMMAHLQHDLNLGYRRLIWAGLGPHMNSSCQNELIGLKRRVNLAILAAQMVLPIWNKFYPSDDLPYRCIDLARQVLNKNLDENVAWEQRNMFWSKLIDKGNRDQENQVVQGVGFSAVQVLTTALRDEIFEPLKIDLNLTDADIDPEAMDSSFFAAAAYANGAIWNSGSDSLKRQKFWEWWLKEAVPMAWAL